MISVTQTKIFVHSVSKIFPIRTESVCALDDISLTIRDGEFFAIVGPSGCGKTTLLRILAGLDSVTGGAIEIMSQGDGRPLNSMVFQEQSVFPWMTVRDNVAYGLRMRGIGKTERYAIADRFIRMIGLTKFADAYPCQLSGGMKQRVSVARAFANDPDILLMDEPFGALDEQNRIILQQELLRIWEEHVKTTVFITHSIDEAIVMSDRVMVMTAHPGRIKDIITVDLPRPRDIINLRTTAQYTRLYQTIWHSLRDEVMKVKEQELSL